MTMTTIMNTDMKFQAFAQPWWVNLFALVPLLAYLAWRRKGLDLAWRQLFALSAFALAFGFAEASVVVYLRAAVGLLPGFQGTLADVQRSVSSYDQSKSINQFPPSLLTIEGYREAATVVMLLSLTLLAAARARERWAVFLWTFALWDISYYAGLWATIRWPSSFKELDVLFLIPVPWVAQVWFPVLVSALTLIAVVAAKKLRANR
jgi:hypothetical protein